VKPSPVSKIDPYLDGDGRSFKGFGVFVEGLLSEGPAFFIAGTGFAYSLSEMKGGRPKYGTQCRGYHEEG